MKNYALPIILMLAVLSGCYTSASFILPPNTDLMINGKRIPQDVRDENGRVKLERRPFFWNSIMGINYMLLEGDKVVKKDKLPSSFRVVSIFWPPYAYLYWPVGFGLDCYDLSNPQKEFIEGCGENSVEKSAGSNQEESHAGPLGEIQPPF